MPRKYANVTNKVVCQGSSKTLRGGHGPKTKKSAKSSAGRMMASYCKARRKDTTATYGRKRSYVTGH